MPVARNETGERTLRRVPRMTMNLGSGCYFQPDSLSQAARSFGCDFSHVLIDCVSLSSIFSFMHMQYVRMTAGDAPPLLSSMHLLTHLRSSEFIFWAKAPLVPSRQAARTKATAR